VAEENTQKLILLVDDDDEIMTAMKAAMKQLDVRIDTANNGNQAIDKVEKIEPDLVVLDMMLPRKSGFLVMERIRLRRERAQSPLPYVIMVTGNPGQRHKQYAQTLGVNEYLNKPFRMDRLISAIEKLLGITRKELK
jgi:CheY-like chemotaxis protein